MKLDNKHIILFDGICNLCNASVNYIIKKDKKNIFLFASLQSDAGKAILLQVSNVNFNNKMDSIIYIRNKIVFTKAPAVLRIALKLHFPVKLFAIFLVIPKFISNFFYGLVSKNRYRWFGKKQQCMVPSKEILDRFIL